MLYMNILCYILILILIYYEYILIYINYFIVILCFFEEQLIRKNYLLSDEENLYKDSCKDLL